MNDEIQSGGFTFMKLLTIAFIVLKLTCCIDWPWLWVLSPLWIPIAVTLLVMGVVIIVELIGELL